MLYKAAYPYLCPFKHKPEGLSHQALRFVILTPNVESQRHYRGVRGIYVHIQAPLPRALFQFAVLIDHLPEVIE